MKKNKDGEGEISSVVVEGRFYSVVGEWRRDVIEVRLGERLRVDLSEDYLS